MTIRIRLFAATPSFQHNHPSNGLQNNGNPNQDAYNSNVCSAPFVFGLEDGEASKYVDRAKNYDTVPDHVVVNIPVEPELVILVWPQEERKKLFINKKKELLYSISQPQVYVETLGCLVPRCITTCHGRSHQKVIYFLYRRITIL